MDPEEVKRQMSSLYEQSGGDPTQCQFCDEPPDDTQPWQRGLDGAGAHLACLRPWLDDAEEEK